MEQNLQRFNSTETDEESINKQYCLDQQSIDKLEAKPFQDKKWSSEKAESQQNSRPNSVFAKKRQSTQKLKNKKLHNKSQKSVQVKSENKSKNNVEKQKKDKFKSLVHSDLFENRKSIDLQSQESKNVPSASLLIQNNLQKIKKIKQEEEQQKQLNLQREQEIKKQYNLYNEQIRNINRSSVQKLKTEKSPDQHKSVQKYAWGVDQSKYKKNKQNSPERLFSKSPDENAYSKPNVNIQKIFPNAQKILQNEKKKKEETAQQYKFQKEVIDNQLRQERQHKFEQSQQNMKERYKNLIQSMKENMNQQQILKVQKEKRMQSLLENAKKSLDRSKKVPFSPSQSHIEKAFQLSMQQQIAANPQDNCSSDYFSMPYNAKTDQDPKIRRSLQEKDLHFMQNISQFKQSTLDQHISGVSSFLTQSLKVNKKKGNKKNKTNGQQRREDPKRSVPEIYAQETISYEDLSNRRASDSLSSQQNNKSEQYQHISEFLKQQHLI